MPKSVLKPTNDQYYEYYRRGMIERHVCSNGLLLTLGTWLVEKGTEGDYVFPSELDPCVRDSMEEVGGTGEPYHYVAYPLVIPSRSHSDGYLVVGGGDNPLLYGGIAMATLCMEDLRGVSQHSFGYAKKLLAFFLDSEWEDEQGSPTGFLLRKRHHWHDTRQASSDELCGVLLGLFFYIKAAKQRQDAAEIKEATDFLRRIASHLKENDYLYKPPPNASGFEAVAEYQNAWIFQFPFSRIFKEHLGDSYRSGKVIPWWPITDENLIQDEYILAIVNHITGNPLDFSYTAKDLYLSVLKYSPLVYAGSGGECFYNLAMVAHTTLMVLLPDVVDYKIKKEIANQAEQCFFEVCRYPELPAHDNIYFALVAKICAEFREYSFLEGMKKLGSDLSLGFMPSMCRAASAMEQWCTEKSGEMPSDKDCDKYEWTKKKGECLEEKEQGYNDCDGWRDEGYSACCDWWPCSWGCKALVWIASWVCKGWTWVTTWLCVAWAWIHQYTCKVERYVVSGLCTLLTWPTKKLACVRDDGWDEHVEEMLDYLVRPKDRWFHDLPIGEPKPAYHPPFNPLSPNGQFLLGGECFAWEDSDSAGHCFTYKKEWGLWKAAGELGPLGRHMDYVTACTTEGAKIPKPGLRLESTGLGFTFPRMLMGYLDIAPIPIVSNDVAFPTFPFKGPQPLDPNMKEGSPTECGAQPKRTVARRKRTSDWLLLSSSM